MLTKRTNQFLPDISQSSQLHTSLALIKPTDKLYSVSFGNFRARVTGVEPEPAIPPASAWQSKKVPLSAAHFDDGSVDQVIFG
jgi:hypothetical protein